MNTSDFFPSSIPTNLYPVSFLYLFLKEGSRLRMKRQKNNDMFTVFMTFHLRLPSS